jgi:predicted dehydrogenase
MSRLSRRQLLTYGAVGVAGAVAVPYVIPSGVVAAVGKPGANERLTIGVIGMGRRGNLLIDQLPEQGQIAAVADCFLTQCHKAAEKRKAKWRIHQDCRKLLDEKDIDAVMVATPDHGRVLVCIRACQAGKDIYAEKPLTLCIHEGRVLVEAARKYQRVVQVGSQQRCMAMNQCACEFVRNGSLGKNLRVKAINYPGPQLCTGLPKQSTPKGADWDMWLGQAEFRPYNDELWLTDSWKKWRDYSGGQMTNWGAHGVDQIQCALGMDDTGPVEIWPVTPGRNGKVSFRYANGVQVDMELEHGPEGGAIFIGENGKIEINRNKFTTNPKHLIKNPPPESESAKWRDEVALWQAKYHIQNWMDCIKTREKPIADVEIGHRSVSVCHLCNIAREVGRKIKWNPETEQIVDDNEANALVSRPRRKGYELPGTV